MARNPVEWSEECECAFQGLKDRLYSSPVLQNPGFTCRFLVQVDAFGVGIGAVLAQGEPGEERPVLYLCRNFADTPPSGRNAWPSSELWTVSGITSSWGGIQSTNLDPDHERPKHKGD